MTASIDTAVRLVKQAILQVSQISESGSFFIMILWGLLCSFITTETDKYRYLVPAYRYLPTRDESEGCSRGVKT